MNCKKITKSRTWKFLRNGRDPYKDTPLEYKNMGFREEPRSASGQFPPHKPLTDYEIQYPLMGVGNGYEWNLGIFQVLYSNNYIYMNWERDWESGFAVKAIENFSDSFFLCLSLIQKSVSCSSVLIFKNCCTKWIWNQPYQYVESSSLLFLFF